MATVIHNDRTYEILETISPTEFRVSRAEDGAQFLLTKDGSGNVIKLKLLTSFEAGAPLLSPD